MIDSNVPKHIDIHTHVNFAAFADDYDEVIKRALDAGVWLVNVGTQIDMSRRAIELADRYERGVYAIVGLHPVHTQKSFHDTQEIGEGGEEFTSRSEVFDYEEHKKMCQHPKVIGIGETGLDYYHLGQDTKKIQENVFRQHIDLALETDLPLMLHIRPSENSLDAYSDALDILAQYKETAGEKLRGNVHFFAGDPEIVQRFLELGFTISFTGVVTFARMYEKLVRSVPEDKILVETDAPYVAPHPHRGKRNEPLYVQETASKIARILHKDPEEFSKQLVENTITMFTKIHADS